MKKNFYFGLIILVLYLFAQLISPLIIQKYHIELSEPELKTYRSDEVAYLKIFYLVDHGYSYYEASEIARTNFSGGGTITNDVFTWRFPTIFYFWSFLFDSGKQIFTFFIFLSLCLMLASYLPEIIFWNESESSPVKTSICQSFGNLFVSSTTKLSTPLKFVF